MIGRAVSVLPHFRMIINRLASPAIEYNPDYQFSASTDSHGAMTAVSKSRGKQTVSRVLRLATALLCPNFFFRSLAHDGTWAEYEFCDGDGLVAKCRYIPKQIQRRKETIQQSIPAAEAEFLQCKVGQTTASSAWPRVGI